MKKAEYTKKKLQPLTIYLSLDAIKELGKAADQNKRSRKAQAELILEDYCTERKNGAK